MDWDSFWMLHGGRPDWALQVILTTEEWALDDDNQPMRTDYGGEYSDEYFD